jgi:hypothetical protein
LSRVAIVVSVLPSSVSFMFEQQPQNLQLHVQQLANEALQKAEPSTWFEVLYAQAQGDTTQIPWVKLSPHPYLLVCQANFAK